MNKGLYKSKIGCYYLVTKVGKELLHYVTAGPRRRHMFYGMGVKAGLKDWITPLAPEYRFSRKVRRLKRQGKIL